MTVGIKGPEIRTLLPNPDIVAATLVVAASNSLDPERADYQCDGVNDNVEIQAALDALPASGGKVLLLAGTYNIAAAITLDSYQALEGEGSNTLLQASVADADIITATGGSGTEKVGISVENLRIDGASGGVQSDILILWNYVDRSVIRNCWFRRGVGDFPDQGQIVLKNCDYCGVKNNISYDDWDNFVYFNTCTYCEIAGNHVEGYSLCYIEASSYCTIANNVGDVVGGTYFMELANASTYCTVIGNIVSSCAGDFLFVPNAEHLTIIGNECYHADGNGIDLDYAPFSTVVGNVMHDVAGNGISLDSGTDITVVGNVITSALGNGISVDCDHAIIKGNMIYFAANHGIYVEDPDVLVEGNYIYQAGQATPATYHGIYLTSAADRSVVKGNVCADDGTNQEDGINLASGCDDCVIEGNKCYNGMGSGICLVNCDNCTLDHNDCRLNDDYGIEITAGSKNIVRSNYLETNVTGQLSDGGTITFVYEDNIGIEVTDVKVFVRMKNTSGGQLVAGDVVVFKAVAAGNEFTTTVNQGDDDVCGMVAETIADTASGWVQTRGKTTALKVNGTAAIAIGDWIGCFTAAGIGMQAAAGDMAFARALEAYAGADSNGVIDAVLEVPRKI